MEQVLNEYQKQLLKKLYYEPLKHVKITTWKRTWVKNNDLTAREYELASWEDELVKLGYISREDSYVSGRIPQYLEDYKIKEREKFKIEDQGRNYIDELFSHKAQENALNSFNPPNGQDTEVDASDSMKQYSAEKQFLSTAACALMHAYMFMADVERGISKNNCEKIAKSECGLEGKTSGLHLHRTYIKYTTDSNRINFEGGSLKSAKEHLSRFKVILPRLEKISAEAYSLAEKEYQEVEKKYQKTFDK